MERGLIRLRYPGWVPALAAVGVAGSGGLLLGTWGDEEPGLVPALAVVGALCALLGVESLWFAGELDADGLRVRSLRGWRRWRWSELRGVLLARAGAGEAPTAELREAMAVLIWGPAGRIRLQWLLRGFEAAVAELRRQGRLGLAPPPRSPSDRLADGLLRGTAAVADGLSTLTQPLTLAVAVALAGLAGFLASDLHHLGPTGRLPLDAGCWAGGLLAGWVAWLGLVAARTRRTTALRDPWELGFRTCVGLLGALMLGLGVAGALDGDLGMAGVAAVGGLLGFVASVPGGRAA